MSKQKSRAARLQALREHSGWILAIGITCVILGALCLAAPMVTGVAVAILVGGIVLVHGVAKLIHALKAKSWGAGVMGVLGGLLPLIAGGLMIAHPLLGLTFLTLLVTAYFFADGIATCILALMLRPLRGWVWSLVNGLLTILLGVLVWAQWPLSGAVALGILVGISIFLDGLSMIVLAWGMRTLERQGDDAAGASLDTAKTAADGNSG